MPLENLEEEGLPKNPDLRIAQLRFLLSLRPRAPDPAARDELMAAVRLHSECGRSGDLSVRVSVCQRARFVRGLKAGGSRLWPPQEGALTAFRKTYDKTVALGHRLDIVFYLLRIGLFYMDNDLITRNIEKAKSLIEEGGDWDRRNRLKVYQGLYCVAIRDFKQAAELFLDTVSTFTSYELMDYKTFVTYTVYVSMIALDRPDLREKVIKGAEILEVLHSLPAVRQYLFSLYECRYAAFFQSLAIVEQEMKKDWLFAPHYRYYVREMRIHAYSQLLESYRSLTLGYMAEAFGVSVEFIDQELSRFIAAGRLHCKIDKVNEIVETNRPDSKNWQYQETIKKGDLLLNRVQKLSRVINM
ncbi:hypothetical protein CIB84_012439 [Bambusicola thoracicus]|uniref:26S proteasome non-ATPase regulatory subunit 6 n=1 Tax=Bambusicola thoracicus TaxID=9083 RepID=A0A2P4SIA7_BAMTH|nr:hypothetical protein CIB84_012439 [Bambusicola thoracicus]